MTYSIKYSSDIRLKIILNDEVYVTCVDRGINFDQLRNEIITIYAFPPDQDFTMKWIDEEGDPCILSSQIELDEAFRLYRLNEAHKLKLYIFLGVPSVPGMHCQGEDRNTYRHGARKLSKLYGVNGHIFRVKWFNKRAFCIFCNDRIWGLGCQGFKCIQCKLLVHKNCREFVRKTCAYNPIVGSDTSKDSTTSTTFNSNTALPVLNDHSVQNTYIDQSFNSVPVEDQQATGDETVWVSRPYCISDFELIKVIGRGSFAKVLMVELKQTKCIYAMKVIKKISVLRSEDIRWAHTEKNVFTIASNHPFLVSLHSCFQSATQLFFVIELVRGGDLLSLMQTKKRLSEEHSKFYAAEISIALNFLHTNGIMFRDLKLDNVLLDHEGHIKLTDYGICKQGIWAGDTTSTFCGTPNYIAPEVLRRENYGFSVDWWALGILLYEMLVGYSPFDSDVLSENPDQNTEDFIFQAILEKTVRIPRSLSVRAASVLIGFLNKNPNERLGCHPLTGFNDIVIHRFFKTIDFEKLEKKKVIPPHVPHLVSDRDISNFPKEFTNEAVQLSPDSPIVINNIDQSNFEDFDYLNPLLISMEDNE